MFRRQFFDIYDQLSQFKRRRGNPQLLLLLIIYVYIYMYLAVSTFVYAYMPIYFCLMSRRDVILAFNGSTR